MDNQAPGQRQTPLPAPIMRKPEPAASMSSEQLVEHAKTGSHQAFEQLVERYEKRLFNYLYQLTGNRHDAEDLAQDTFLKVYQNLHRYDPAFPFEAWLFTIARRMAIDHYRTTRTYAELPQEIGSHANDPELLMEANEQAQSIWGLARTLKKNQFEVLWLKYGEGFSVAQIAKIMKLTQIHVKVLLHRARQRLAKICLPLMKENRTKINASKTL